MNMLNTSRRALLGVGLAASLALLPATAAMAQQNGQNQQNGQKAISGLAVPVSGTVSSAGTSAGTVAGTLTINRFANRAGSLVALGTFVGTVTNTATGAVSTVVTQLAVPVNTSATTGTCDVLHLVLGPLDLDLLGLQVHLNQVVLDITAVPGAGNLLGNLLCAVAHLLDGGSLAGLSTLLNNILAALGGL